MSICQGKPRNMKYGGPADQLETIFFGFPIESFIFLALSFHESFIFLALDILFRRKFWAFSMVGL
jgi:hypothetical protein